MRSKTVTDEQFDIIQELLSAIYIQLARNYDMLCISTSNQDKMLEMYNRHKEGKVFAPAPLLTFEEEDE
jgi:hypothetical protein